MQHKCPCEECICIPVCKHKSFYKLFQDCIYLRIYEPTYLIREQRGLRSIQAIHNILKSTAWTYEYSPALINWALSYAIVKIRGRGL